MLVQWTLLLVLATYGSALSIPRGAFLPSGVAKRSPSANANQTELVDVELYDDTLRALWVMQREYYKPNAGTWPTAIDWTAAVLSSHVAGAMQSLSKGMDAIRSKGVSDFKQRENLISIFFSQLLGFYFGQDSFSLRNQAFDDMLWVVLGWLDTIRFVEDYSNSNYAPDSAERGSIKDKLNHGWHGIHWTSAFAHRARIFWHLAEVGWDTKLCGGGMNWNPKLTPYKNAITNELYISASIAMFFDFPGDNNDSPFVKFDPEVPNTDGATEWKPRDPKYLEAAIEGYAWLATSNMTNEQGLYADGFHISGYKPGSNRTACDERDEMVYTYNQGVILSAQRGLYRSSGRVEFLQEGHALIQNVIKATGWDLEKDEPTDDFEKIRTGRMLPWHGLGRLGILEEACDIRGDCSQDAQTFKGIWMHHFTAFCAPLPSPTVRLRPFTPLEIKAMAATGNEHSDACKRYYGWLKHNANSARATRNHEGKFGMWWTAGLLGRIHLSNIAIGPEAVPDMEGATDYRNDGVPNNSVWMLFPNNGMDVGKPAGKQRPLGERGGKEESSGFEKREELWRDPNDRGRGRTVETQSGGLALLRALWEISQLR